MKLIFFGASHAFFMAQCAGSFSGDWNDVIDGPLPVIAGDGSEVGHLVLASPRAALFELAGVDGQLTARINPHYASRLLALDNAQHSSFFLLGGNEHNSLFMCRHPVPFDFHDERSSAPLQAGRQIIPTQVVRDHLQAAVDRSSGPLKLALASLAHTHRAVVAPPPPIPSEEHVLGTPEAFDFAAQPLEDRWVRLKIYRLYLDILTELCASLGVPLLGPPRGTVDEHGFLAREFWNAATHAQPAYYRSMLSLPGE